MDGAGNWRVGDPSGDIATWDQSSGTLSITGTIKESSDNYRIDSNGIQLKSRDNLYNPSSAVSWVNTYGGAEESKIWCTLGDLRLEAVGEVVLEGSAGVVLNNVHQFTTETYKTPGITLERAGSRVITVRGGDSWQADSGAGSSALDLTILGGTGGDVLNGQSDPYTAGAGSNVFVTAGNGGDNLDTTYSGDGGDGGDLILTGGAGGTSALGSSGSGGSILLKSFTEIDADVSILGDLGVTGDLLGRVRLRTQTIAGSGTVSSNVSAVFLAYTGGGPTVTLPATPPDGTLLVLVATYASGAHVVSAGSGDTTELTSLSPGDRKKVLYRASNKTWYEV